MYKMTEPVKTKKYKKIPKHQEVAEPIDGTQAQAPVKTRKPRAKPTKEEKLLILSNTLTQLKVISQDLKDDNMKLEGLALKQVPFLMTKTLQDLDEDCREIEEEIRIVTEEAV